MNNCCIYGIESLASVDAQLFNTLHVDEMIFS